MSSVSEQATLTLFGEALSVVNRALSRHREDASFQSLIAAAETALADRRVGVAIYVSDSGESFDYYGLRFQNGTFRIVTRGEREAEIDWTVSRAFLEDVVANADQYIENPRELDWDWLQRRLDELG